MTVSRIFASAGIIVMLASGAALAKGHFQAGGGAAENGQGNGVGKILADSLSNGGGGRVGGTVKDGIDLERANDGVTGPGQSIAPGQAK